MKKTLLAASLATLASFTALFPALAHADRLDDIKKAGVLRVATFDSNPPFGFVDPATNHTVGLDVDYAKALADKLGVKLELQSTNPANRIPFLTSKKVDLVLANFTITDERAKQVDFSIPYFSSGQQFLAKKGVLTSKDQLNGFRIGADKGTTNEIAVREQFPKATIVAYDDTPFAFAALRAGNVQAITQDGPKLVGLLANVPDKQKYEIPPFTITNDYMGVGIPKGEPRLVSFVNDTLKGLEANGTATTIYNRWFGPTTKTPLTRTFKIGDKT
ncbi:ABC transporter substrate-binding protein [Burkholderia plantarii]|uniref:Putative ABC amino acid transporter, periplasmic ligand binding protein n=1 Tax=Burkholderia plantarii TaxID=41899 RepID=A0A0B6S5G8_BURPL|nr:ABC transporter substrate-binding protein [Burkholderia plantarii]AJK49664.1 putative ABC amino acid transporter, periplasmic ligand binding protein [Burkholderia plantarii]ALK33885.1 amino acid ABC transporter substrate-binding protein [Burkholderia plantarii]WLE62942.1 ABC transporter substrate-binding protein [Burkholderia plantarii]GLZ19573.1 amino acid ABC transporter substrate-binding protein [Burkholderia plantarii]